MNMAMNVSEEMAIQQARIPTFKCILGRTSFLGITRWSRLTDE
jgi:hypothetical protein